MGVSTLDVERIARESVAEDADSVLPCASLEGLEVAYEVGRRPDGFRQWYVRAYLWFGWNVLGIPPHIPHQYIGMATGKEIAEAACLDETYYYMPQPVNKFLPREPTRLKGLRFPKSRLHRLLHREPPPTDYLVTIRESEVRALNERLKKLSA